MNSFLWSNSTDKWKKSYRIIQILEIEIFHLNFSLSTQMIGSNFIHSFYSIWNRDTVRECKWVWFLFKQISKRWPIEQFFFIWFTDCCPLVTVYQCTFTWIYHVAVVTEPLSWKLVNSIQVSFMIMWVNSSFIGFL